MRVIQLKTTFAERLERLNQVPRILKWDRILKVQGIDVSHWTEARLLAMLSGNDGRIREDQVVSFTFQRDLGETDTNPFPSVAQAATTSLKVAVGPVAAPPTQKVAPPKFSAVRSDSEYVDILPRLLIKQYILIKQYNHQSTSNKQYSQIRSAWL